MTNKTGFSHHKNQKRGREREKVGPDFYIFSSFVSVSHETRAPPNIVTSESLRSSEELCNYWEMDDKKMSSFIESVETIFVCCKIRFMCYSYLKIRDNNFKAVLQNPDLMHFSYVVLIAIWRPIQV